MIDFAKLRQSMVDGQIRTNDVTGPRVLQAFLDVPREAFVPGREELAYLDRDIPVDAGGVRRMMQPMVLAKLVQAAAIGPDDRVLVVGCATGYSAVIVSRLAARVWGLESDPALGRQAGELARRYATGNLSIVTGPLEAGWASESPYDLILIDGAVEVIPQALVTQLTAVGRLVCVYRETRPGRGTLFRLCNGAMSAHSLFDAHAPALPQFARRPEFVF